MSWLSARGFTWVQRSALYQEIHAAAVGLLPPGQGRQHWLDVGCGPGLVGRLAAERGYVVQGVDVDPHMVEQARREAGEGAGAPTFRVGSLWDLQSAQADVVSAASLLAVLPDRRRALNALMGAVAPAGQLLLIEPSEHMNRSTAQRYLRGRPHASGAWALRLWAATRNPDRAVHREALESPGWSLRVHPLCDGLVNAWVLSRAAGHFVVDAGG